MGGVPAGRPGPWRASLLDLLDAAADLVLPRECAGCARPGPLLCPQCRLELQRPPGPVPVPGLAVAVAATAPYDGAVRAALLAHKEQGRLGLGRLLGAALARAVRVATGPAPGPLVLVPVPSRPAVVRQRGYDATVRLARHAARDLRLGGADVGVQGVLRLARRTADQAGLSAAQRAANLRGAMVLHPARSASRLTAVGLVVVDDVVTTGATLAEAVRALRAGGLDVVAAAAVAATVRRRPAVRVDVGAPVEERRTRG